MILHGSKHIVEHKFINYSCVDGEIYIIRITVTDGLKTRKGEVLLF
jgi:hypothetical protein